MKRIPPFLYRLAGISGFLAVLLFRRNLAAEAHLFSYFGRIPRELEGMALTPESIGQIFQSPFIGLCYFDFFDLINVLLVCLLFLPLVLLQVQDEKKKLPGLVSLGMLILLPCFFFLGDSSLFFLGNLRDTNALSQGILAMESTKPLWKDLSLGCFYGLGLLQTLTLRNWRGFTRMNFLSGLLTNSIGLAYFFPGFLLGDYAYLFIVLAAPFTLWWQGNTALHTWKMASRE